MQFASIFPAGATSSKGQQAISPFWLHCRIGGAGYLNIFCWGSMLPGLTVPAAEALGGEPIPAALTPRPDFKVNGMLACSPCRDALRVNSVTASATGSSVARMNAIPSSYGSTHIFRPRGMPTHSTLSRPGPRRPTPWWNWTRPSLNLVCITQKL